MLGGRGVSDPENTEHEGISIDHMFLPLEVAECVMGDCGLEQADISEGHVLYWEVDRPRGPALVLPLHDGKVSAAEVVDALERRGVTWEEAMDSLARCSIGKEITLSATSP